MAVSEAPRVLIGFAEAISAPEVAWSLLDAGYRVHAFSRSDGRPSLRRCRSVELHPVTPPAEDADASLAEIRALVERLEPDALMPLDDAAVRLCDQAARGSAATVAGPTGDHAALALDKRVQLEAARDAGFAVPDSWSSMSPEDAARIAFDFPVMAKPALAIERRAGRLVAGPRHACANAQELHAALEHFGDGTPFLVQPFIEGVGEGLFGIARDGEGGSWSAHRRIRMMSPEGSGSSACVSIPVDPELRAAAERMLRATRWDGLFMFELLRDSAGTAWFVELNGRSWGSMALARRQGLEYPAWAVAAALDPAFAPPPVRTDGPVVCRHLGRELVHLLIVMRGRPSSALTQWPTRRRALREVLRLRRGERWYNLRRGALPLFLDDTVQTVAGAVRGALRG